MSALSAILSFLFSPVVFFFNLVKQDGQSNNAQTAQAFFTFCLLMLAAFGYFYTVRPVYTKQQAEELAAKFQREAAQLQEQSFQLRQSNSQAQALAATLQEQTVQLSRRNLYLAIDPFVVRALADAANLLRTYDLFIGEVQRQQSERFVPYHGSIPCLESDQSAAEQYATRLVPAPRSCLAERLFKTNTTGRDIINRHLRISNSEIVRLESEHRDRLITLIRQFADNEPNIRAVLIFRGPAVLFLSSAFPNLSDEDRAKIQQERERQEGAHKNFIQAMDRLRQILEK